MGINLHGEPSMHACMHANPDTNVPETCYATVKITLKAGSWRPSWASYTWGLFNVYFINIFFGSCRRGYRVPTRPESRVS